MKTQLHIGKPVLAVSQAYTKAKKPSLKLIRSLKVGDVIRSYYTDTEEPQIELVIKTNCTNKTGTEVDLVTINLEDLGKRGRGLYFTSFLNTDKFEKLGRIAIEEFK
jgi:hypothetical protein